MGGPDTAVLDAADVVGDAGEETSPPAAGASPDAIEPRTLLVVAHGLSAGARARLGQIPDLEVVEAIERAAEADVILVSTRLPGGPTTALVTDLASRSSSPVVVVVHPGGEGGAVALLAAGGAGVVAEGNEEAMTAFVGRHEADADLVETYEQSLGLRTGRSARHRNDRDPIALVAGPGAFSARLGDGASRVLPRLGVGRFIGLESAGGRLGADARDLLRRRLVRQCQEICTHFGATMYATGPEEFAVVAETLDGADFEQLATDLQMLTHSFSPDRGSPLVLAFGHAGPESSDDMAGLHDLAERSADMAMGDPDRRIVGAEQLTVSLAPATALTTVLRAVAEVERRDPYRTAHGERVARTAVALAQVMQFGARQVMEIGLSARLHHVGKVDLDDQAVIGTEETLQGEALHAYRRYPARGAGIIVASAGRTVADAVAAHHERWDGSGFPDGLVGDAIPPAARIIAVADMLDRWSGDGADAESGGRPTPKAVQRLTTGDEGWFDPAVVDACLRLYGPAAKAS